MRRSFFAVLVLVSGIAAAQPWPAKPVRIIVPFAPGGITDSSARLIAPKIQEAIGQPVIVENKLGAGGVIATDYVAKSAPDGYALLMGSPAAQTLLQFVQKLPYDGLKDFAPVTNVNTYPLVLMVHPSVAAQNVRELIALAKAQPGKLNFAGAGGLTQFSGEIFKYLAGVDLVYVPYKGGAPATAAAAAGDAQVTFANYSDALAYMKSGRLRPLGITSARRFPQSPDVPTIAEAGVPGYEIGSWLGVSAPAATPLPIVQRLNTVIARLVEDADFSERLLRDGAELQVTSPERFTKYVDAEVLKWAKLIRDSGAKQQ